MTTSNRPALHRDTDPATSREAAHRITRRLSALHEHVLAAITAAGDAGMTGRELEQLPAFAGMAPSTIRKRASELHQLGRVRSLGRRDGLTIYGLRSQGQQYHIWSDKHAAWWRPNQCGYTRDLLEAGVYSHSEAVAIVNRTALNPDGQRSVMLPIGGDDA